MICKGNPKRILDLSDIFAASIIFKRGFSVNEKPDQQCMPRGLRPKSFAAWISAAPAMSFMKNSQMSDMPEKAYEKAPLPKKGRRDSIYWLNARNQVYFATSFFLATFRIISMRLQPCSRSTLIPLQLHSGGNRRPCQFLRRLPVRPGS